MSYKILEEDLNELRNMLGLGEGEDIPKAYEEAYWDVKKWHNRRAAGNALGTVGIAILLGLKFGPPGTVLEPVTMATVNPKLIALGDRVRVRYRDKIEVGAFKGFSFDKRTVAVELDRPDGAKEIDAAPTDVFPFAGPQEPESPKQEARQESKPPVKRKRRTKKQMEAARRREAKAKEQGEPALV